MKQKSKEPVGVRIRLWVRDFVKQMPLQMMVLPGIVFMIVFNYIPIYGLKIAFQNYTVVDTLDSARWVGMENFKIILTDKYFWDSVYNTLGISFLKLLFGFVTPILLAVMIYELKDGLFNSILKSLGLITEGRNILLDADKYWWIASLSDVWKSMGWGTILYLASMAGIDPTYYEAARIDGASRVRQVWSITLPLIKTIIGLNFILTVSGLLGSNLDQTLVLMNTQNQPRAEVINSYVYRMGIAQGDFSYASAAGLGVSIVSVILLVAANKLTSKLNEQSVL